MISDPKIMTAVSRILQRSERQDDPQKILGSFVDFGILTQLNNQNNQIFYGRRGTGKTHVLRVIASHLSGVEDNAVIYIDARALGSTAQFSDPDVPIRKRCLALFRDILSEISNGLREFILKNERESGLALQALNELTTSTVEPVKSYLQETIRTKSSTSTEATQKLEASSTPRLELGAKDARAVEQEMNIRVQTEDKIIFPSIHRHLETVLREADCRLYLLLDEWSSLPQDIQPYVAEFLKRGLLPVSRATLKIASLEYRSRFESRTADRLVGFELGADIATAPDLDDYYVYDRNPHRIRELYGDILCRHLLIELPGGYLRAAHGITNGKELVVKLFSESSAFDELCRSSEGVARDLINIFTLAFFDANRRGRASIDRTAIMTAARQWFEQDKSQQLDEELHIVLRRIVDEVISHRKARSFLLPRELERHPMVQKLFDARVLHLVQRGYADKESPGDRYSIYTIDYGTYVDLLGTSHEPQSELFPVNGSGQLVVPFDDKRTIRQITLPESVLEGRGVLAVGK